MEPFRIDIYLLIILFLIPREDTLIHLINLFFVASFFLCKSCSAICYYFIYKVLITLRMGVNVPFSLFFITYYYSQRNVSDLLAVQIYEDIV